MKVLDKRTGKMKYRMFDAEPGWIRCPHCGLNLCPGTLYERGSYFLHGRDFCPKCREPFYISPLRAAGLNAEIKREKDRCEEELRLEKERNRFLPIRENHEKIDPQEGPDDDHELDDTKRQ